MNKKRISFLFTLTLILAVLPVLALASYNAYTRREIITLEISNDEFNLASNDEKRENIINQIKMITGADDVYLSFGILTAGENSVVDMSVDSNSEDVDDDILQQVMINLKRLTGASVVMPVVNRPNNTEKYYLELDIINEGSCCYFSDSVFYDFSVWHHNAGSCQEHYECLNKGIRVKFCEKCITVLEIKVLRSLTLLNCC